MASEFYINKYGVLCYLNRTQHTKIVLEVQGFYAPVWTDAKLEKYVHEWKKHEIIRPIKKPVLR